jgi:hypothetical protein
MNVGALWESFSLWIMYIGIPLVGVYHLLCVNPFLNVSAEDAKGLEKVGNVFLTPSQYLLAGRVATPVLSNEGTVTGYRVEQRFDYEDPALWVKTAAAYCVLPSSLIIGGALKGLSYLSADTQKRGEVLSKSLSQGGHYLQSNNAYYESLGIDLVEFSEAEKIVSEGYERRPGDSDNLLAEKEALKEIISLFNKNNIVYWLDCGTCLGAYRYGGSIPWDWDIDVAILQPDFDNVLHLLSSLDPKKYVVQDWSSRDKPKTYLKVYVKESWAIIDIYHFAIDADKKEIHSILSNEGSVFLPESWRVRERRFTVGTPYANVFPLRKATFDGVEAFVPKETKRYLQQRYGENIAPAKVYDPALGEYVKDENHPYWQQQYVNSR